MENIYPVEKEVEIKYKLPIFEGPLDLLLYLIEKNELDIYDIPISLITSQYNEFLFKMKELNLFIAADFIDMASTLIHIKSQMLLPKSDIVKQEKEKDPRDELVQQLLEKKKFIEAGQFLLEREEFALNQFYRTFAKENTSLATYNVEVWDLIYALKEILKRGEEKGNKIILIDEKNLLDKINEILAFLKTRKSALFEELLFERINRNEIVVTFLALLELAHKKEILLFQDIEFGPIRIVKKKNDESKILNEI